MAIVSDYIARALDRAECEMLDDGTYAGEVPGLAGVLAWGSTLSRPSRSCEVLECWLLLGVKLGHHIPPADGVGVTAKLGVLEPM